MLRIALPVIACLVCLNAANVGAQDQPRASLLRTTLGANVPDSMGGAVDRLARAQLQELNVVDVRGTLALDLDQVQLALGCLGESAECLGQVATENQVDVLVVPRVERSGSEYLVTFTAYDGRGEARVWQVARRIDAGEDGGVLDSIDEILRELFEVPAPEVVIPPDSVEPPGIVDPLDVAPPPTTTESPGVPMGGIVLAAAGAAILLGGGVAAILHQSSEDDYQAQPIRSESDIDEANSSFDAAQRRGRAAMALFAIGGAVAIAGVTWIIIGAAGGSDDTRARMQITPVASLDGAGVALGGTFGGSR